jgi:AMMECR1 domain-containing protein
MDYTDSRDLLKKLRPGIDGLSSPRVMPGHLLFPKVWEQLPDKEEFLGHLCMKAGLNPDEWKKGRLKVQTYQVQYFEEGK